MSRIDSIPLLEFGRQGLRMTLPGARQHRDILDASFFQGTPSEIALVKLREALDRVSKKLGSTPFCVSLPDPVLRWETYAFDKLPWSRQKQEQLLSWRLKQDPDGSALPWDFTWQHLGSSAGKKRLLCVAADGRWITALKDAFALAELKAPVMDAAAHFLFNDLHNQLPASEAGALVWLEEDYWSLLAFGPKKIPKLLRSHWRENKGGPWKETELSRTAQQIARLLKLLKASEDEGLAVARIWAVENPALHGRDAVKFGKALEKAMPEIPVSRLTR